METIKRFTDLEQAKKLAGILPLETADMHYSRDFGGGWFVDLDAYSSIKLPKYAVNNVEEYLLPCWSLAALLDVLSEKSHSIDEDGTVSLSSYKNIEWNCGLINVADLEASISSNPVDACYEMILKLNELNIL